MKADPGLGGKIGSNETAVISYINKPEMRNAVNHSNLNGVPNVLDNTPTNSTTPSLDLRINIRGQMSSKPGRFGDGIIGAQAIEHILTLITSDKELRKVVQSMGGTVR